MPNPTIPTALKILRGNPGKRALPKNEPKPARGAEPPDWMTPEAAGHWPLVAKLLDEAGILTKVDGTALALYCEEFARYQTANAKLIEFGPVIMGKHGYPVQSPYLGIANTAFQHMRSMLTEFGMTPASRTRVEAVKQEDEASPYRKFA